MTIAVEPVLARIEAEDEDAIERLKKLLSIPSVGTDPRYNDLTRKCAEHLADDFHAMGFAARVHETPGQPVLVAHHPGPGGDVPHVLYYGHYDVQPPDPIELWDSAPFEPVIVEGERGARIVARGAVDDKGQVMTWIEAMRAWLAVHDTLPIKVTVLLEGEEESGSPNLASFLSAHRDELAADVVLISDTGMWDVATPAITTGVRGLVYAEAILHGPSHDLHSGGYGGIALNPINALCRMLAGLLDDQGRVSLPGFYDRVRETPAEVKAQWQTLDFDERALLRSIGLSHAHGEAARGPLERLWARPTCDICGIIGGYTGDGSKTVIPAKASAKISFRLVPDQDPSAVMAALALYLEERVPPDGRLELIEHAKAPAMQLNLDGPYMAAARAGLHSAYDRDAVMMGCGGSIPVVSSFKSILGLDALMVGFGLNDDRVHSPNEKFELACFRGGMRSHVYIMAELARMGGKAAA